MENTKTKSSKHIFGIIMVIFLIVAAAPFIDFLKKSQANIRHRISLDPNWKFFKGDVNNAQQPDFNDKNFQQINIPHDFSIEGPFDKNNDHWSAYLPKGIGWYRKSLTLDNTWKDKKIYIEFEGVFRNSTLFVNGQKVGNHPQGYTGVVYDITPFVSFDNKPICIAVKIDNPRPKDADYTKPPDHMKGLFTGGGTRVAKFSGPEPDLSTEGWWYEGCGIYRHVWLIASNPIHVANWGTFVTTPEASNDKAKISVKSTIQNDTSSAQNCRIKTTILNPSGSIVLTASQDAQVAPNSSKDVNETFIMNSPMLWSLETPNLYTARTQIIVGSKVTDSYDTPFGIRWFEFTKDKGFFLNGKPLNQLRGMCIHQDCGGLGMALPDRAQYRDVELMKGMGCQILRLVHNDFSPTILQACDKLGMLLWVEHRYLDFPNYDTAQALKDMIHRNRNHPSIVCWGLANTAGSTDGSGKLTEILKTLNEVSHTEDPTRPTAIALEGNADGNANGFAMVTDLVGYNGGGIRRGNTIQTSEDHKKYPDRKIVISESQPDYDPRGDYTDRGGVLALERDWGYVAKSPWISAGIMWAGIEYWGEPKPWPVVTSQWGTMDMARFPKDQYYYCLQEWTDKPMVHIFPHWNWASKEDPNIKVWCYTNCDEVELLLNGKSLGTKPRQPLTHIEWNVLYQPGKLVARGFKNKTFVAEDIRQTAGEPAALKLQADRTKIKADGCDLSFIKISVLDSNGVIIPTASNNIKVEAQGNGKVLGTCSGNPASHDNPKSNVTNAFNGLLMAIVQNNGSAGQITITATSPNLKSDTLTITAE